MTTDLVRDAMIADPRSLPGTASAQEAGQVLTPPEVRAVYVVDGDGALTGVLTRKTLVAKVVAAGLDPRLTAIGDLAEQPYYTIDADTPLDDAFHFLEEHDAEQMTVVADEHGAHLRPAERLPRLLRARVSVEHRGVGNHRVFGTVHNRIMDRGRVRRVHLQPRGFRPRARQSAA